jgi:iron complex transport system substrate-binding protein
MHRIISLLPSTTEIACALGFRSQLVGRSHECDYPGDLGDVPVCTAARLADGTSREIDDRVKDLVERGVSIYEVNAELLRELAPTAILTQDQCAVCAVTLDEVEAALCDWLESRPTLISLSPARLDDVWQDIRRVGLALSADETARRVTDALVARVEQIQQQAERRDAEPTVACIEWIDPPMSAGNWMPEMVKLAGGDPLFGEPGEHSAWLEWHDLCREDPDILLVTPCGFDLPRTRAELPPLLAQPGYRELSAVRKGRVYLADGNAFFNRPGPRLVESLEILAEILHPELFSFGHEGKGWERA